MKTFPSVLVLGGTTFDHIVYLPQLPNGQPTTIHTCRFQETTGSTGTGKAVALHQLGVPVHLISAWGNDDWGNQVNTYLQNVGLSFEKIVDEKGTERHINLMEAQGKRISIFISNSSDTVHYPISSMQQQLQQFDIIVLNIISYCRPWAPLVAASGQCVWTDLHDFDGSNSYHQPFIDAASHIQLSSDNLPDYKACMENLIQQGKSLVICTHAEKGASALCAKNGWMEVSAESVPIVDTNGAGDNFFAGFLYGWMLRLPIPQCLQMGTKAAASCVQSPLLVSPKLTASFMEA